MTTGRDYEKNRWDAYFKKMVDLFPSIVNDMIGRSKGLIITDGGFVDINHFTNRFEEHLISSQIPYERRDCTRYGNPAKLKSFFDQCTIYEKGELFRLLEDYNQLFGVYDSTDTNAKKLGSEIFRVKSPDECHPSGFFIIHVDEYKRYW